MKLPPYFGDSYVDSRDLCYDPRGWWRHAPALFTAPPTGTGRLHRLARGISATGLPWGAGSLNEPLVEGNNDERPSSGGGRETAGEWSIQDCTNQGGGVGRMREDTRVLVRAILTGSGEQCALSSSFRDEACTLFSRRDVLSKAGCLLRSMRCDAFQDAEYCCTLSFVWRSFCRAECPLLCFEPQKLCSSKNKYDDFSLPLQQHIRQPPEQA